MNLREKKKLKVEQMMRKEICDALRRLMHRISYRDMKMIDIAREAKVSKGTLYNYFSSKEDLVKHFLDEKEAEMNKEVEDLIASDFGSVREKMVKYFEKVFSFADDNVGWAKLFFEYMDEHMSVNEQRDECLAMMKRRHMQIVQEGIDKEGWRVKKPEVKVWLMSVLLMKVVYMKVVDRENCPATSDIIEVLIGSLDAQIGITNNLKINE